jgi:hypothetical protein
MKHEIENFGAVAPNIVPGGEIPIGTGVGKIQGIPSPASAASVVPVAPAWIDTRSNPEREASLRFYHAMAELNSGKEIRPAPQNYYIPAIRIPEGKSIGGKRKSLRLLEMVHPTRKNSRRANRKVERKSRKAERKSRKAERKSRKASRRNNMAGGKRSRKAERKERKERKERGLVGQVYKPVGTLAKGAATAVKNVVGTGANVLNAGVKGLDHTLSGAASTLNRTARNILRPLGLASRRNERKH